MGLIGFFTGLTAYLINIGIHYLTELKNKQFFRGIHQPYVLFINLFIYLLVYDLTQHNGTIIYGLLVLIGFNVVYALVAGTLAAIEVSLARRDWGKEREREAQVLLLSCIFSL